jgi:putative ABC transport system permease protein
MKSWLKDYQYQVDISWWVFIVTDLFAIAIAISTVSFQAIKAAMTNPVKSLRSE